MRGCPFAGVLSAVLEIPTRQKLLQIAMALRVLMADQESGRACASSLLCAALTPSALVEKPAQRKQLVTRANVSSTALAAPCSRTQLLCGYCCECSIALRAAVCARP